MMLHRFLFMLSLLAWEVPLAAQRETRECLAAPPFDRQLWVDSTDADFRSPARIQARLTGRHTLVEITSEGAGTGKLATESEITIWPSSKQDTVRRLGYARNIIGYGRSVALRRGYLHKGVGRVKSAEKPRFFRVQYVPPYELTLTWVSDSTRLDLMPFDGSEPTLAVGYIDNEVMSGRWMSGGFEVLPAKTPVGILSEHEAGYFCAWPIKSN